MGDSERGHDDQGQVVLSPPGDRDLRPEVRPKAAGKWYRDLRPEVRPKSTGTGFTPLDCNAFLK